MQEVNTFFFKRGAISFLNGHWGELLDFNINLIK